MSILYENYVATCSTADDDFLVQVRAQVMTRDDSSGGWLPRNGGGMSVVGVQAAPSPTNSHYTIRGRRVCDQAVSARPCFDCLNAKAVCILYTGSVIFHFR